MGVQTSDALTGSGPFAALDEALHLRIFMLLDTRDVLNVLAVCRGWRALRGRAALWRRLVLRGPAFSVRGAESLVLHAASPNSPLPDTACVEELLLHCSDGGRLDARVAKALLPRLRHAATVTLCCRNAAKPLPVDALRALTKTRGVLLQALHVGDTPTAPALLLDVLAKNAPLRSLSAALELTAEWVDSAARRRLEDGAFGAALRHLGVNAWCEGAPDMPAADLRGHGASPEALARLGTAFPALETLHVGGLSRGFRAGTSRQGYDPWPMNAPLPEAPWAPLPALRALRIDELGVFRGPKLVSTAFLSSFAAHVAAAAPALQSLHLCRGTERPYRDNAWSRATTAPPAIAGPSLSGLAMLSRLQELHLSGVVLDADACDGADLPALQRLTLIGCGPRTLAAAVALAQAAPALRCLAVHDFGDFNLASASPLAAFASATLRELSLGCSASRVLAQELRSLAARRALPALHSLSLPGMQLDPPHGKPEELASPFDAAHPWPMLRQLSLDAGQSRAASLQAALGPLRAPCLEWLSLPPFIKRGAAISVISIAKRCDWYTSKWEKERKMPALRQKAADTEAAYNALCSGGNLPSLRPLRCKDRQHDPQAADAGAAADAAVDDGGNAAEAAAPGVPPEAPPELLQEAPPPELLPEAPPPPPQEGPMERLQNILQQLDHFLGRHTSADAATACQPNASAP